MIPVSTIKFARVSGLGNQKRYPAAPTMNLGFVNAVYSLAPPTYEEDYFAAPAEVLHVHNANDIAAAQIKASEKVGVDVEIDGGWAEGRFTFVAVIPERDQHTTKTHLLVIGYTEPTQAITDETKLFVSRVIRVNKGLWATPEGHQLIGRVGNDDLVIGSVRPFIPVDSKATSVTRAPGQKRATMRPEDFFSEQEYVQVKEELKESKIHHSDNWLDMRVGWAPNVCLSTGLNENITAYLERILLAFRAATTEDAINHGNGKDIFRDARSMIRNTSLMHYPLFSDLARDTMFYESGSFSLSEFKTVRSGAVDVEVTEETLVAEYGGADDSLESFLASRIVGMVNGNLLHGAFKKIAIASGSSGTGITILETLTDDLQPKQEFTTALTKQLELFSMLDGVTDVTFTLTLDVTAFADITVSVNGGPGRSFTYPAFACGLLSAMMT
ncbi:hypothetical protein D3C78_940320 [compost metagenome]